MPIRLTPAVKFMSILMVVLFLLQATVDQFFGGGVGSFLSFSPVAFLNDFAIWKAFTYPFVHADALGLVLNLLMLVLVGSELEAQWGARRFVTYFFVCTVGASALYVLLSVLPFANGQAEVPLSGASSAVFGLLTAYGILFSERVLLFMLLFPMKAKHFIWILAGVQFLSGLSTLKSSVAGLAQLGGMGVGYGFLWARATLLARKKMKVLMKSLQSERSKNNPSHLKLIVDNDPKPGDDSRKTWH